MNVFQLFLKIKMLNVLIFLLWIYIFPFVNFCLKCQFSDDKPVCKMTNLSIYSKANNKML